LAALIPLASNHAAIFGYVVGYMIYPYAFSLVFAVALAERCPENLAILKSIFAIGMVFVIGFYIVGNNIYYLRAHYSNQRAYSLTVRVIDRIEPLMPLVDSTPPTVTVFGALPNEYERGGQDFGGAENIQDGFGVTSATFINYDLEPPLSGSELAWPLYQFGQNISYNHGIAITMLLSTDDRWEAIRQKVLDSNMPIWPAEGAVGIIDDVIVVNFGITDDLVNN
jgi:hypothetical protein